MVAQRLVDDSSDVLAAVVLDAAGGLIDSDGIDRDHRHELAGLVHELVREADAASPTAVVQIEVQAAGGSVYAARDTRHVVACVTRRPGLPALVLYDLQHALGELAAA
jgi:hypothetical protein